MKENATIMIFNKTGESFRKAHVAIPVLSKGEILVKNVYTTLCGSDIHTYCGTRLEKTPTVLGHEIIGQILDINNAEEVVDCLGKSLSVGDMITWSIYASDPKDQMSLRGMPQKASPIYKYGHRQQTSWDVLNGGLASHCLLREHTDVLKVSPEIPLKIATTINCALATVAGAIRIGGDLRGKSVFVSGMGLLGLTCVAMCREAGAKNIIVSDLSAERINLAKKFGADGSIDMDVKPGAGEAIFDVAFEMSGAAEAMETGLDMLAVGGKAVWIGCVFPQRRVSLDAESIIRRLITISGLHNYNTEDFKNAYTFLERSWDAYPFDEVVSKEFSLDDVDAAFDYAVKERPLRVGIHLSK